MAGQGNGNIIGEIRGGCKAKKARLLTTHNTLGTLSGIQVNKADQIAILGLDTGVIYTYNHPTKKGSLGKPVSRTLLKPGTGGWSFVFLASGADVYANVNLSGMSEYGYPAGGAAKKNIDVTGIAGDVPKLP